MSVFHQKDYCAARSGAGQCRTWVCVFLLLCFVLMTVGCAGVLRPGQVTSLKRFEASFTGPFDTVTRMLIVAEDASVFSRFRQMAEDELWRYHHLFNIYEDAPSGVNLKTVNDRAGSPVQCPVEILDLVEAGIRGYKESEGRINIAMGAVLKLWHAVRDAVNKAETDAEKNTIRFPSDEALRQAASHCSIDDVVIDRQKKTLFLRDPDMALDVGAIAKGYAVEQVANHLEQAGLVSAVLNVGGNVRAIGKNRMTGRPWKIGIKDPGTSGEDALLAAVSAEDLSVVTSGNYERSFEYRGKRYSHIIDPETLRPSERHDAVTVICLDSATADLLSTTLMLMSVEEGRQILKTFPGCEALWATGGNVEMTEDFRKHLDIG